MGLTDPSTGSRYEITAESFRKNKGRRTAASRGRNGNMLADT